jgi:hypothetical protein
MTRSPAIFSGFLLVASTLAMSGCGYYYHSETERDGRPVQSLEQTTVCCDSLGELSYRELVPRVEIQVLLDDNDPVLSFDSGKSYVEPFTLPQSGGVTLLQVDSLVGLWDVTEIPSVVFPVVTLLNSDFEEIVTLDQLPYQFDNFALDQKRIRIVVTIDDQYADASYALIHTSQDKLSNSISTRKPYTIIKHTNFDTMLYDQQESSRKRIRFSHSGALNVIVYPL